MSKNTYVNIATITYANIQIAIITLNILISLLEWSESGKNGDSDKPPAHPNFRLINNQTRASPLLVSIINEMGLGKNSIMKLWKRNVERNINPSPTIVPRIHIEG